MEIFVEILLRTTVRLQSTIVSRYSKLRMTKIVFPIDIRSWYVRTIPSRRRITWKISLRTCEIVFTFNFSFLIVSSNKTSFIYLVETRILLTTWLLYVKKKTWQVLYYYGKTNIQILSISSSTLARDAKVAH